MKNLLPLMMMMNGGGGNTADMLKAFTEMGGGKGGDQGMQSMLPMLMSMFQKNGANASPLQKPSAPEPVFEAAGTNPDFAGETASVQKPTGAQFFSPILDFANEKIVYHLSLMLR